MGATVDLTKFVRSVRLLQQIPDKHGPDVLNKSLAKIAIGAKGIQGIVQRTEKATAEGIRADMQRHVTSVGSRGGTRSVPLIILLATKSLINKGLKPYASAGERNKRGKFGKSTAAKLWRALVKMEAKRILASRVRSRGYIVAGWLHALDSLRNKAPSAVSKTTAAGAEKFSKGSASKSYAIAARGRRLVAALLNTAEGADKVSTTAICQAAIDAATADNMAYARRKFGAAADDALKFGGVR